MKKEKETTKVCKNCGKYKPIESFGKRRANRCKQCDVIINTKRKQKMRDKIKEYIGGEYKCARCSFTYHRMSPFDFHHKEPVGKENIISQMLSYSWEKVKVEIDKCELLCANCHRIEHEVSS